MAEITTPMPEQPTGDGLGVSLLKTGLSVGFERSSTVHRTLRFGASPNTNVMNTWLGWKQTTDEMQRFSDPSFGRMNWRRYVPWGGKVMGSPWAPSSWMMGADLVQDRRVMRGTYNVLSGISNPYAEHTIGVRAGSSWYRYAATRADGAVDYRPATKLGTKTVDQWEMLGSKEANFLVNKMLRGGTAAGTDKSLMLDLAWNAWFKGNGLEAGTVVENAAAKTSTILTGYNKSKVGFINKVFEAGTEGYFKRMAGAEAMEGITKFASVARGAFTIGGVALKAYNWGTMAYYGSKAAYKGWELYNIKAPMAAYKAVGSQLLRPGFSSGDASLLTGIPASNRMRAVQAIQGSRLNARSALGSEASMLAGHFG